MNSVLNFRCYCDLCGADLAGKDRYDGAVKGQEGWAVMGDCCFPDRGVGLGIGRGQKFDSKGICIDGNKTVGGKVGRM